MESSGPQNNDNPDSYSKRRPDRDFDHWKEMKIKEKLDQNTKTLTDIAPTIEGPRSTFKYDLTARRICREDRSVVALLPVEVERAEKSWKTGDPPPDEWKTYNFLAKKTHEIDEITGEIRAPLYRAFGAVYVKSNREFDSAFAARMEDVIADGRETKKSRRNSNPGDKYLKLNLDYDRVVKGWGECGDLIDARLDEGGVDVQSRSSPGSLPEVDLPEGQRELDDYEDLIGSDGGNI